MSKPTKSLKTMCKKLGVRLTIKRGQKRVYKSVAVLKKQCAKKKKARGKRKVKRRRRRRRFGTHLTAEDLQDPKYNLGATKLQALARGRFDKQFRAARKKAEAERRRRMMYALGAGAAGLGVGAGLGGYAGYHYRPRRRFGRKRGQGYREEGEDYGEGSVSYAPKIQRRQAASEKARMSAARKAKLMKYLKYAGLGTAGLGALGGGYAGYRYYKRRRGKKKKGKKKKGKKKK